MKFTVPQGVSPKSVKVLGINEKINWKKTGNQVEVKIPASRSKLTYATVIQLK
ncbi:hypothetical protein [Elizabethkingia sp. JS20170427COW]|uniref:hypothetical protein n=1 Tax=Elizabethkingia sp. JS20170427COW TaxID=2583851 RepID=UPI0021033A5C|nr:hypothetical protein [Elizabethkingia sp. JS20170427COW]